MARLQVFVLACLNLGAVEGARLDIGAKEPDQIQHRVSDAGVNEEDTESVSNVVFNGDEDELAGGIEAGAKDEIGVVSEHPAAALEVEEGGRTFNIQACVLAGASLRRFGYWQMSR